MNDCIFCDIVKGESPSWKVYEDELVMAFLDIYPAAEGHTLVIPKKHAKDIYDVDVESLKRMALQFSNSTEALVENSTKRKAYLFL